MKINGKEYDDFKFVNSFYRDRYKECKEKNISDDLINYGMLKILEKLIEEDKDIDYAFKFKFKFKIFFIQIGNYYKHFWIVEWTYE